MKIGVRALERAFELAKSGDVSGITDIRAILIAEGYDTRDLEGNALRRQLREAVTAAQEKAGRLPAKPPRKPTFRKHEVKTHVSDQTALPDMPANVATDYDGSAM